MHTMSILIVYWVMRMGNGDWLSWIGSCNNFITQVLPQMILANIISVQANLFPNCAFHADEYVLTFYFQRVCMLALEVLLGTE